MIQARHHDLIAWMQGACKAATDGKRECRHIRTKNNLLWTSGVQEIGDCLARLGHRGVRFPAGAKCTAVVGIGCAQILIYALYRFPGNLCPTGIIKINGIRGQGREMSTYFVQIEHDMSS